MTPAIDHGVAPTHRYHGLRHAPGSRYGQCCRIVPLADGRRRGRNGSVLLEFADGTRAVVPWRCVRRVER